MDNRIFKYIVAINEEKSITRAADRLYITQSALNQVLLKEEEEIGTKLFFRSKKGLRPTPAGEIYLKNAREVLKMCRNTMHNIRDFESKPSGTIRLGLSFEHGVDFFIAISRLFDEAFPRVSIHMQEMGVQSMRRRLRDGSMDLAFVMQKDMPRDIFLHKYICSEPLICGVPATHKLAREAAAPGQPLATIDLARLKNEKFALMYAGSTMREVIDPLFQQAGFQPDVHYESIMNQALYRLTARGLCCTIMPVSYARPDRKVAWFRLDQDPVWSWWFLYTKDHYLSAPEQFILDCADRYAAGLRTHWQNNGIGIPADPFK